MGDAQVGAYSGLVLVAEAFVHILVHERGFADTRGGRYTGNGRERWARTRCRRE
jgi:hypothetical protein